MNPYSTGVCPVNPNPTLGVRGASAARPPRLRLPGVAIFNGSGNRGWQSICGQLGTISWTPGERGEEGRRGQSSEFTLRSIADFSLDPIRRALFRTECTIARDEKNHRSLSPRSSNFHSFAKSCTFRESSLSIFTVYTSNFIVNNSLGCRIQQFLFFILPFVS